MSKIAHALKECVVAGWLLIGVAFLTCSGLGAQVTQAPAQLIVQPAARAPLEAAWRDTGATQPERAYCVHWHGFTQWGTKVIVLDSVSAPDSVWGETPYTVGFTCHGGTAPLHTHTPSTCRVTLMHAALKGTCSVGGTDAWECQPSPSDQLHLTALGLPFALIQCSRHGIIAYYPWLRPEKAGGAS